MENKKQEESNNQPKEEIVLKCASCGANLSENVKKCEYCGSLNPNFKPKELKLDKLKLNKNLFGGVFGNVFDDVLNNFDGE